MTYKYQAHAGLRTAIHPRADFHATLYRYKCKGKTIKKPVTVCHAYYPEDTFTAPGVDAHPLWEDSDHKSLPEEDLPLFDTLDEVIAFIHEVWEYQAKAIVDNITKGLPVAQSTIIQRFI